MMLEYSILEVKQNSNLKVIVKHINLDERLDFFLLIESSDFNFAEILEQKILDLAINNIKTGNTYKDFSIILEKINHILKIYNKENDNYHLNILIAISFGSDFMFSQVGQSSLYLIKEYGETLEITDKKLKNKEFKYISEGKLENNDILVLASFRLLNYLSYTDFIESAKYELLQKLNKNIELILKEESYLNDIGIISLKYIDKIGKKIKPSKFKQNFEKIYYKIIDNNFVKLTIAYIKIIIEKLEKKSKLIRNIFVLIALLFVSFSFFIILSKIIDGNTKIQNKNTYKQMLLDAKIYKTKASNNYDNPELFYINIKKSEELLKKLKEKNLYLNDLTLLEQDLNSIKKAFNGIEIFEENNKNLIYNIPGKYRNDIVSNINIYGKDYIITKKAVIGPILKDQKVKITNFDNLGDDEFSSVASINSSLILLTKFGKIVEFNKANFFTFKDVIGQNTWEKADIVRSYGKSKIYLVNKTNFQIYKHEIYGKSFTKAYSYIKSEDQKYIGKVEDIAIDGGFYILKSDLKILKFFSKPYRLEKIQLKKLPKLYKKVGNSKIKIIARKDLNYIYILLNNKIWIFKPNTRFYTKVQSLSYLGQIEFKINKLKDFYVEKDGLIKVLSNKGLYRLSFNENDGKVLINNN